MNHNNQNFQQQGNNQQFQQNPQQMNQNQNYQQQGQQYQQQPQNGQVPTQGGQQQVNTVDPQGAISMQGVTAPTGFEKRERRTDIQNLPSGLNAGILFALVDLGTHMESFQGSVPAPKRKIFIGFEHPQLKQLFYQDDTERKSTMTSKECTFNVGDKAFLRKVMHAVMGRVITQDEANRYDISTLIGSRIGVQTIQNPSKKDATKIYDKVEGVMSCPQTGPDFVQSNKSLFFFIDKDANGNVIGNNFRTQNYADLPGYIKKKILASNEAKEYMAKGGAFAKNPKREDNQQNGGGQQQVPQQQAQQMQGGQGMPNNQQQYQQQPQQGAQGGAPQQQFQQQGQPQQMQQAQAPQQNFAPNTGQGQAQQGGWSPNGDDDDVPF